MKLTDTQLQQVIDSFAWSNHNKGITGDILRQFIQHLKDSVPLAKLADGKTIQEAITLLQAGVGTEGEGTGAAYESQLLLANAYADMGIEAGQLQSDFNAAVNAFIAIAKASPVYTQQEKDKLASLAVNFRGVHVSLAALQTAIPTGEAGNYAYIDTGAESVIQQAIWDPSDGAWRMGASPVTGIDDVTGLRNELDDIRAAIPSSDVQDVTAIPSYDETSNYPAGDTYVSYVNQFALEAPFNQLGIYKAEKDALPAQSPETDPYDPETGIGIWWYVGNKLVRDANVTTRGFVLSTTDLINITSPRNGDTCGLLISPMSVEMCYRFDSTANSGIKPADIDAALPGRWVLSSIRPLSPKARAVPLALTDASLTIYPGEMVLLKALQGRTSIGVTLYSYPTIIDNNYAATYSIILDNSANSQDMAVTLSASGTVTWGASGSIDNVAAGKVLRIDVIAQKVDAGVVYYVGHDKGGGTILTDEVPTAGSTNAVQSGGTFAAIKTVDDELTSHTNTADEQKHSTNQIVEQAANALLSLPENSKLNAVIAAITTFLQGTINANAINDPSWQISENRLAMLQKLADGSINIQGSALLVNIFAPPGVDASLTDRSGWTNESKTITGTNTNGELGKPGQVRILADGTYCWCQSATAGASGSATYKRNRAHDVIDTANAQDLAVANALELEAGWDVATQTKVLTIAARLGTFHKQNGGYFYWCYAISGSNSYWWRNGTPPATPLMFNASSHPTLTGRLLAHDFSVSLYTVQSGDEATKQGQEYWDVATRKGFRKITTTQFERIDRYGN